MFGIDPKTGYARSPWDNVGVQYGLKALNDGVISFAQFIDINKRIGGHDVNGKIVAERQVGDPEALQGGLRDRPGQRDNGGNADIPIIGIALLLDGDPFGRGDANVDVHDRYHSLDPRRRAWRSTTATPTTTSVPLPRPSVPATAPNPTPRIRRSIGAPPMRCR